MRLMGIVALDSLASKEHQRGYLVGTGTDSLEFDALIVLLFLPHNFSR